MAQQQIYCTNGLIYCRLENWCQLRIGDRRSWGLSTQLKSSIEIQHTGFDTTAQTSGGKFRARRQQALEFDDDGGGDGDVDDDDDDDSGCGVCQPCLT